MIFWFLVYCLRSAAKPWLFFQLNANYFNRQKKIYSKLEIDRLIPKQWRLPYYSISHPPKKFPVFIKPEWGQNSYGVQQVNTVDEFDKIKQQVSSRKRPFIYQVAAEGMEIEVFFIRGVSPEACSVFKIIHTKNDHEAMPINSVLNPNTQYRDITDLFSKEEQEKIWQNLNTIGQFRIARVGIKTASLADLVGGAFKIVEINLLTPMPLNLLDPTVDRKTKNQFIKKSMCSIVEAIGTIPKNQPKKRILFHTMLKYYQMKS